MNALAQLPWRAYGQLMRLDRPIGIWLLLWPTWWALWLAADGLPDIHLLVIFSLGVLVMRSAGCVINDWADRDIDRHVARTRDRPLTAGVVGSQEALILFGALVLLAFGLVLLTDPFTIALSLGGLALAAVYPFMKRLTWWPQVVLGAAFSWAIPMAFAAQAGDLPRICWLLFVANLLWTVAYDTLYAMADRPDDLKIGVKSTAILFGRADRAMVGVLQASTLLTLFLVGRSIELGGWYQLGLLAAAVLFGVQHWNIRHRDPARCLAAFKHNHWVGMAVWAGLALDLGTR